MNGAPLTLSVLIPAHNEGAGVVQTAQAVYGQLRGAGIPHEILVVLDHCTDDTATRVDRARSEIPTLRASVNTGPGGYGFAVRHGLREFTGDAVAIVMADASDDPRDLVTYHQKLLEGYDCVFGSRFMSGATVRGYPLGKLWLNRFANRVIAMIFGMRYNDCTNAFKCYRRDVISGLQPLISNYFNLTVEMPLKAMVRGFSWTVVPTNWYGRQTGESKFRIKEMGSRYLFIILYALVEKYFARGDYLRTTPTAPGDPPGGPANSRAAL